MKKVKIIIILLLQLFVFSNLKSINIFQNNVLKSISYEVCENSFENLKINSYLIDYNPLISDSVNTETSWKSLYFFFIELFGKSWYSLNFDMRLKRNFALSFGTSFIIERDDVTKIYKESFLFPTIMSYYLIGKKHSIEFGGSAGSAISTVQGFTAITFHAVVGYRFQIKNGLLFRVGFTPLYSIPLVETARSMFVPLFGISFGYSF